MTFENLETEATYAVYVRNVFLSGKCPVQSLHTRKTGKN